MGRRKSRTSYHKPLSKVAKVFECPECGEYTIRIEGLKKDRGDIAVVICGNCGIRKEVPINKISEPVDVYGDFIDIYLANRKPDPSKQTKLSEIDKGFLEF